MLPPPIFTEYREVCSLKPDLSAVIQQMTILFLIIGIGYAAAKAKLFPQNTNRALAQLVIYITNPCTVLYSVLGSERGLTNREVFLLTVIAVVFFAVVIGVGLILPRVLGCDARQRKLYAFMCTFSNMGFLGFPVVSALYGADAVFYASIFNLIFQLVVYTYGVWLMQDGQGAFRLHWRTFCTPIILASVVAYVCYLTDFSAPAFAVKTLNMLANVTSPLCMLVIGVALANVPVGKVFTNWRLYVINLFKLLVLPLLAYALLHRAVSNPLILGITVVIAAMPVATMSTILAAKYDADQELAACGVFLSTLMSLATIPLVMLVLFR